MSQTEYGATTLRARSRRFGGLLGAVGLSALLIGIASAPWASGAPREQSAKTLHLAGVVTAVHKHRVEEEFEIHSTVELMSGSKKVGELSTDDCSALAVHFLICSGKDSLQEFGSGHEFHIEWPCVEGEESRCSSVGQGFLFGKSGNPVATLRVNTSFSDFMKLHERFPVVIKSTG